MNISNYKTSIPTKIALGLLLVFIITNISLSYISLTAPTSNSEFALLGNFITGITALLVGGISVLALLISPLLFKQKRWSYILSIILVGLLILILTFSNLREIGFNLTPGASISLNKEVLPIAILLLLLIGRKDFRKAQ